ncbi:hypothetical protein PCI56_03995 [Plesiomonas shigelloides subsp. oncorhynchi]|nr:hypothetical protein [Plesiomonas shigelloides]
MSSSLESLKEGIRELILTHGKSSKSMTVERLFEPISEAIKEGITLELLCSYLQQNGIQITPSYLKKRTVQNPQKRKRTCIKR